MNREWVLIALIALSFGAFAEHHEKGFESLTKGGNLDQWQTKGNWSVDDDGLITIVPREGETGWQRFDAYLWSKVRYDDFTLDLEFRIPEGGNSGIFVRVGDLENPVDTGIEVQINDTADKENPGPHDCGGIISTIGPSKNMAKPAGEWNRFVITCKGNQLKVEHNGEQIVDIQLDETVLKDRPLKGYIGLQDHGLPCEFRNVKIKSGE